MGTFTSCLTQGTVTLTVLHAVELCREGGTTSQILIHSMS